jgi:ribA/ribD-fused uncharacterized protein
MNSLTFINNDYIEEFDTYYIVYFKEDNTEYSSVEHYYQSKKSNVIDHINFIREARTALEAYKLGNILHNTSDWNKISNEVMFKANKLKFDQNPKLFKKLVSTDSEIIVKTIEKENDRENNSLALSLMALRALYKKDYDTFSRYSFQLNINPNKYVS